MKKLDEKDYTSHSWDELQTVLLQVQKVVDDENATQDDVDQAFEKLNKAIERLVKVPAIDVDPEPGDKPSQDGDKDEPTIPEKPGSSDKVETGDKAPIVLMATLMALSGAAYCFIRRKEN